MDIRTPTPTNRGDWIKRFGDSWKAQMEKLRERFPEAIEEIRMPPEQPTDVPIVYLRKESVPEVLSFVKDGEGFEYNFLADITATDEGNEPRFEVVYNLYSIKHHYRIRFKARIREGESVPTLSSVWPAANWAEREVWDMFGILFAGHPDLRRILMDERWEGHPLRKDYPLRGYQIFSEPMPVHTELLNKNGPGT